MSSELAIAGAERDQMREWFAELNRAGEEFEEFVAEQLDQLVALGARIDRRELDLATELDDLSRHAAALADSKRRLDEAQAATVACTTELRELVARCAADTGLAVNEQITALTREREQLVNELQAARASAAETTQTVGADLASARAMITSASEDLARERERLSAAVAPLREAVNEQLTAFAHERTLIEEQLGAAVARFEQTAAELRAIPPYPMPVAADVVAAEPETVQSVELATSPVANDDSVVSKPDEDSGILSPPELGELPIESGVTEPTPPSGEALRAGWWEDLKQLRSKLGNSSRHVTASGYIESGADSGYKAAAAVPSTPQPGEPVSQPAVETSVDPALDSVLAQFEMLQQELGGRRKKKNVPHSESQSRLPGSRSP